SYISLVAVVSRLLYFFFFSSRRRHTRWPRDWSSDVCSSDLGPRSRPRAEADAFWKLRGGPLPAPGSEPAPGRKGRRDRRLPGLRSEERRVGKECRCRWWTSA